MTSNKNTNPQWSEEEEFELEYDDSLHRKMGQANLDIEQAINELIANSIDSWDQKFEDGKRPKLKIIIEHDKSKKILSVTDNAFGMDINQLKDMTVLGKTDKSRKQKLRGHFGFGVTVSTSSLGGNYTAFSKKYKSRGEVNVVNVPVKLLGTKKVKPRYGKVSFEDSGLFDKQGTRIEIGDLKNQAIDIYGLNTHFGFSWKYFLEENELGPPIEIILKEDEEEIQIQPHGIEYYCIEGSLIDISIPVKWIDIDSGKEKQDSLTGKFGFSVIGGTSDEAGGLNLYREGQLIKKLSQDRNKRTRWYGYHPDYARFFGEINADFIPTNAEKNFFETNSNEYQAAVEAFRELPTYLVIDPDECIDCGACISECPVEAIFADTDVPADQEEWIERNETECVDAEVAEGDSPILADD